MARMTVTCAKPKSQGKTANLKLPMISRGHLRVSFKLPTPKPSATISSTTTKPADRAECKSCAGIGDAGLYVIMYHIYS